MTLLLVNVRQFTHVIYDMGLRFCFIYFVLVVFVCLSFVFAFLFSVCHPDSQGRKSERVQAVPWPREYIQNELRI